MKKTLFLTFVTLFSLRSYSQEIKKPNTDKLLKELSENGCKCIDSIVINNKTKAEVAAKIGSCIELQTGAYQMGSKLMEIEKLKENAKDINGKKQINISINTNTNSVEYKKYYYDVERYLMENCPSLKEKIASNDKQSDKSFSENKKALDYYSNGLGEAKKENYEKAVHFFEQAVKEDPQFAFAWDNLGVNYRKLNNYDKAIESYERSLQIDPNGTMPLQNIAVVYQFKKEYQKAIDSYRKLAAIDSQNPEINYGIGNIYATKLNDLEKGLDYMCKAYNMYVEQKSPYRADAEKIINIIHKQMKEEGKEEKFNEILKANKITTN